MLPSDAGGRSAKLFEAMFSASGRHRRPISCCGGDDGSRSHPAAFRDSAEREETMREDILIEFVRNNPYLYDKKHSDYKNTAKKNAVWKHIAASLGCSPRDCMVRWVSLRDRFTREMRKMNEPGGSSKPEWHHLKSLRFLEKIIRHRTNFNSPLSATSEYDQPPSLFVREEAGNDSEGTVPPSFNASTPLKKKLRRLGDLPKQIENLTRAIEGLRPSPGNQGVEKDQDYYLVMSLHAALKAAKTPRDAFQFRKKIRDLINEIEESCLP